MAHDVTELPGFFGKNFAYPLHIDDDVVTHSGTNSGGDDGFDICWAAFIGNDLDYSMQC